MHGRLNFLRMVRGKHDPVYRRLRAKLHFVDPENAPPPIKVGDVEGTPIRGTSTRTVDWQRVMSRCRPSICLLQVDKTRDGMFAPNAFGTAFGHKHNLLATAGHSLENADVRIYMPLPEPVAPEATKHRNVMHGIDCGLIQLPQRLAHRVPALPTQERIPEIGEEVAAIGYPYVPNRGIALVMQVGTVSALMRSYKNELFIQVSFHTGGGLSGSPLVDRRGYVLGIMVESLFHQPKDGENPPVPYGQSVPIGYLHYLSDDPWEPANGAGNSSNGGAPATTPLAHGQDHAATPPPRRR